MNPFPLISATILLFLVANFSYFWQVKLGFLGLPISMLLVLVFLVLVLIGIVQLGKAFNEKFVDKNRNWTLLIMSILLALMFYKPRGIINFERFEGEDLLVASREGAANCTTTIKLKANYKFKETNICFSLFETTGSYKRSNDTIFFYDVKLPRNEEAYFEYALIQKSNYSDDLSLFQFMNEADSVGKELFIVKNELFKK